MVLLFSPANVITMVNIYKQLSICLNKDYVWAIYLINMIEDSLVCQSTLKSCRSVRSVTNILRGWTHSFMYSNVNNLKNLLVANLPNYGNNYYQDIKILTKKTPKKSIASGATPRHPASVIFQPKLCPWSEVIKNKMGVILQFLHPGHLFVYFKHFHNKLAQIGGGGEFTKYTFHKCLEKI